MRNEQQSGEFGRQSRGGQPMEASDLRARFRWLEGFSDEELREISYCSQNEMLQQGEQYFDISHPERGIITASQGDRSPEGACYVSNTSVSPRLWHRLTSFSSLPNR